MSHDVFISHSSKDKTIADAVCATLEAKGIRCWIAPRDILPGRDYGEAIIDAITQCRFMILVLSSNANRSPQVTREVERAVNKGVVIIPFRVEDVALSKSLEFFLSSPHWLDALTPPLEKHIEYLAETILLLKSQQASDGTLPSSTTQPLPPPAAAPTPVGQQTSPASATLEAGITFKDLVQNPEKLVGQRLGSYVLRQPIGKGGSGVVFNALNPRLGLQSCVKVFYPLRADVANVAKVIERGVRGVASLNHPNIVKVFDFGTLELADASSLYLVMEFVQGRNLSDWIRKLSVPETVAMAVKIAEALQAAHQCRYFDEAGFEQRGVLHGDIKPANIIIRPDNSPVLLDFMMVDMQRLLDRAIVPAPDLGMITAAYGTPNYMAPEQEELGIVTVKTDIYSLGKTFYELFYPGDSQRFFMMDSQGPGPAPDEPFKELRALLRRMTNEDQNQRPRDMAEVVDSLKAEVERATVPDYAREGSASISGSSAPVESDPDRVTQPLSPPRLTETLSTTALTQATISAPSAASAGKPGYLELLNANMQPVKRIELSREDVHLGRRDLVNDLADDPAAYRVSRYHALVSKSGERFYLRDLQSANGTFVNGQRISEPVVLSVGDQIQLGVNGPHLRVIKSRQITMQSAISESMPTFATTQAPAYGAPAESFDEAASAITGALSPEYAAKLNAPLYVDENVQFTVYRPRSVAPEKWYSLLAFAHLSGPMEDADKDEPDPVEEVRRQAQRVLGEQASNYQNLTQDTSQAIPREGEITFVPEMPGIEFNPPRRSFVWEEPVHREDFRLRAAANIDGQMVKGRLSVFLGSILLADIPLSIRVNGQPPAPALNSSLEGSQARPYRKIFASYSHRDRSVVDQFERFVEALGDRYLRDVTYLRAGEMWSDKLEEMISKADIFQLFWSTNSMDSPFVKREWEYALSLQRPNFIRPTYWEDPLPAKPEQRLPPEELMRLHFQRIQGGDDSQEPTAAPGHEPRLPISSPEFGGARLAASKGSDERATLSSAAERPPPDEQLFTPVERPAPPSMVPFGGSFGIAGDHRQAPPPGVTWECAPAPSLPSMSQSQPAGARRGVPVWLWLVPILILLVVALLGLLGVLLYLTRK